jgi:hypothetical protein
MFPVVIKIGDVEYDTGSFITDQPVGSDWQIIAEMVEMFANSQDPDDFDYEE